MTALLRCEVSPGMFDNEVAVCIRTSDGTIVSMFVPADFVQDVSLPDEKAIPVVLVEETPEYGVVTLPRRTFEGSNVARVPRRALSF